MGAGKAVRTMALGKTERAGAVNGNHKVGVEQAVSIKDLFSDKGLGHVGDDILTVVGIQQRKSIVQGVTMWEGIDTEQGVKLLHGWTIT